MRKDAGVCFCLTRQLDLHLFNLKTLDGKPAFPGIRSACVTFGSEPDENQTGKEGLRVMFRDLEGHGNQLISDDTVTSTPPVSFCSKDELHDTTTGIQSNTI